MKNINKIELKPCPFCGGQNIDLDSCKGLEERENYEACGAQYDAIVCNWKKGGCGASSGYYPKLEKAIEAWNSRAEK